VATISRNTNVKETYDHSLAGVPIVLGQAINQGDVVMWDTTLNSGNGGLRVAASQADMATYMGVAGQQSPIASLGDQINNLQIFIGGVFRFHTTAAEVYKMFTKVFLSETADAQTIIANATGRTIAVGYVIIPQELVMKGVLTITGAAGIDVQVWLTPNFPVATI
jgi:hypothetical protein